VTARRLGAGDDQSREPIVTVLDLPAPPSVNRTRKIDWRAGKKFKGWTKAADALVLAARCRSRASSRLRKVTGRFSLEIVLSEAHTGIDADNGLKGLIDYLRRIELITDDSPKYMRELHVRFGHAPEGCRVTITEIP
jgi:Holliday junction resolvase RusA-like endonuclease